LTEYNTHKVFNKPKTFLTTHRHEYFNEMKSSTCYKKPCQFELTHQLSPFFPCVGKHRLGQTSEKRGCGHGRRRWEKGAPMYIINCAAVLANTRAPESRQHAFFGKTVRRN